MPDPITVLVVEDEALVRMDIIDQLEDFGFRVLEAANATEAVKMLTGNSDIQIMFTDVDMPGELDGLRLAAAVRNTWSPIKIIVNSGHRKVRIDDMPADSQFFAKPFNPAWSKRLNRSNEFLLSHPFSDKIHPRPG